MTHSIAKRHQIQGSKRNRQLRKIPILNGIFRHFVTSRTPPPPFSPTKTQDLFAENLAYLNMLCSVSLIILKKLRSGKKNKISKLN